MKTNALRKWPLFIDSQWIGMKQKSKLDLKLLKYSNLSIMSDFYKNNLNLFAVYSIVGTRKTENISQSILCGQDKLEETKRSFDKIASISIYSLHKNSATLVQSLLNFNSKGEKLNKDAMETFSISLENDRTLKEKDIEKKSQGVANKSLF